MLFEFWDPVVDRVGSRLDGWRKGRLCRSGRLVLISGRLPISVQIHRENDERYFMARE